VLGPQSEQRSALAYGHYAEGTELTRSICSHVGGPKRRHLELSIGIVCQNETKYGGRDTVSLPLGLTLAEISGSLVR
jgi:hypothetical protein